MSVDRRALTVLGIWTVFVWGTRLRNVLEDATLDTGATVWRLVWIAAFVGLAVICVVAERRSWASAPGLVRAFGTWTVGFWLVRSIGIAGGAHTAGFVAVHLVLALVSVALVAASWPRRREVAPAGS